MIQQYAVFIEDGDKNIGLLCKAIYKKEEYENVDFRERHIDGMDSGEKLSVVRFDTLDAAKTEANERAQELTMLAGVVPVDRGEHEFARLGERVRIGNPVYVVIGVNTYKEVQRYDPADFSKKLKRNNKHDESIYGR